MLTGREGMVKVSDGYYFMFEIGWFLDLLIPSIVRVKDGSLHLIASKPHKAKDLKPCCIPAGGEQECKKLSLDDSSLKAFKSIDSLVEIQNIDDLERELEKSLEVEGIREKYLNTTAKKQREAVIERVANDYQVLSHMNV
jgi:hypothetical protein